ncbi:MAG: hypothetical protein ACKO6E_02090, partial [Planctomycetota bacterium]
PTALKPSACAGEERPQGRLHEAEAGEERVHERESHRNLTVKKGTASGRGTGGGPGVTLLDAGGRIGQE